MNDLSVIYFINGKALCQGLYQLSMIIIGWLILGYLPAASLFYGKYQTLFPLKIRF